METVTLKFTWSNTLSVMMDVLQHGTVKAVLRIRAEFVRMAQVADLVPEMVRALSVAEATIERLNRHNSANGTLDVIRAAIAKVAKPDTGMELHEIANQRR